MSTHRRCLELGDRSGGASPSRRRSQVAFRSSGLRADRGGNRSSIVKRTSQGSPVQVNVSAPAAGCRGDSATEASLSGLKSKLDDLRWVLTLILAAPGLFTVVQGIAAGFSAQNFQKQAEDAIKRLEKESDRALADLQRQSEGALDRLDKDSEEASRTALQRFDGEFQAALANLDLETKASFKRLKDLEAQLRTLYPLFEKDRLHAFSALRDHISKFSLVKNLADGFDRRRRFYERIDLGRVEGRRGVPQVQPSHCSPFPLGVPQYLNRKPVSSPRHIERSGRISRTTLTCLLHVKGYVTYRAGAAFGSGSQYFTR